MQPSPAVLLVDDDAMTLRLLSSVLQSASLRVTSAASGEAALELLAHTSFDVVLTDIWMEAASGIDVLVAARQIPDPPEVIIITGSCTAETAIAALRAGAFNYLTKPCAPEEILSSVLAAVRRRAEQLRRSEALSRIAAELSMLVQPARVHQLAAPGQLRPDVPQEPPLVVGELVLDQARYTVSFAGRPIHLTPTEFALLVCLAESAGRVVTWTDITARTHQASFAPHEAHDLLRVHVGNIRRKIAPAYLLTVRGVGFMLVDPVGEAPGA
jgi:two-component system, OmpR family, response regulator